MRGISGRYDERVGINIGGSSAVEGIMSLRVNFLVDILGVHTLEAQAFE